MQHGQRRLITKGTILSVTQDGVENKHRSKSLVARIYGGLPYCCSRLMTSYIGISFQMDLRTVFIEHLSVAQSRLEEGGNSDIKAFTFRRKRSQLSGLIQLQKKSWR